MKVHVCNCVLLPVGGCYAQRKEERLWKTMSCPSVTSRCPWPTRVMRQKVKGEGYPHITKDGPLHDLIFAVLQHCLDDAAVRVAMFEA